MTINRGPILTSVHLVGALAVLGVASLLILNSPGLVTLGLWMLVLPGLILIAIVNVFFYLLAFSVGWFVLVGRKGRAVAIKGGLFAVVFFAIGLPALLDLRTRAWVWWATVRDRATASKIVPAPSVGLQLADQTRTDGRCDDLCLALLYNGVAQRVDTIPTKADAEGTKPTAFSYRIERRGTCSEAKDVLGQNQPWLAENEGRVRLADSVRLRIAAGECLVQQPAGPGTGVTRPELTIRLTEESFGRNDLPWWRFSGSGGLQAIEIEKSGQVVARGSKIHPSYWSIPLSLGPTGASTFNSWAWNRHGDQYSKLDIKKLLREFTTLNVDAPKGADPATMRRALDRALDDPSLPATNAAFGLVEDYFREVRDSKSASADDVQRLARLISDDRVPGFLGLPLRAIKWDGDRLKLKDPILNRLPQLMREKKWHEAKALAGYAASLQERAFRDPDPRLDELLSDREERRLAPGLITRLSERGPSAAEGLFVIMIDGWKQRPRLTGGPRIDEYGADSQGALLGLCRLGRELPAMLPRLRQAVADGVVPQEVEESTEWRATLVSMGARSSEFVLPRNRQWRLDLYREDLEKRARNGCRE